MCNSLFTVRIYRHFLDDDDSYGKKKLIKVHIIESGGKKRSFNLKANDPLYQLTPNNIGGLYEHESTNEIFEYRTTKTIEGADFISNKPILCMNLHCALLIKTATGAKNKFP